MDGDDIGMLQFGRILSFAVETGYKVRVVTELPGHHFKRHAAFQGQLIGLIHDRHATPAQLCHHSVVAGKSLADLGQSSVILHGGFMQPFTAKAAFLGIREDLFFTKGAFYPVHES